jgi:hypothetical protein
MADQLLYGLDGHTRPDVINLVGSKLSGAAKFSDRLHHSLVLLRHRCDDQ